MSGLPRAATLRADNFATQARQAKEGQCTR
jgi:hypothetical protein